ncbi:AAA family ATPase [Chlamydiales bacterium]|nr:AAA family ATPase [Chlamydiales bacterium]
MYIKDFLFKIEQKTGKPAKRTTNGYNCCCPAHDDNHPSLSVREALDGKILLKCYAGCSPNDICTSISTQVSDLFTKSDSLFQKEERIEYIYTAEDGTPLYKKIRTAEKNFFILSYSESGHWEKGLKVDQRVLYQLPEVISARDKGEWIFIVEGEKDADKLRSAGLVATTPIEGAGSNLRADYAIQLEGTEVVLLYDEDKAGYKRRDQWLNLLNKKTVKVRVVKLPGLQFQEKSGEDVSDWLNKEHTTKDLIALAKQTHPHNFSKNTSKGLLAVDLEEFLSKEISEREMILSPIIPSQGLSLLYSKRGIGKTFLSLAIGYAVAAGIPLLRWQSTCPFPVLYVDGEMLASLMQERITKLVAGSGIKLPDPSFFRLITPDLQPEGIPDISTERGQLLIEEALADAKLLILDNLSTLAPSLQENEADSWGPIQSWLLKLRKQGISVLIVHHAGKSGRQRGTSRREDVLDSVVVLKHASDYKGADGASFEVHIEKARGFFGEDAEPFVASLHANDAGALIWNEIAVLDDLYDDVTEGIKAGKSYRNLANELGVKKSKIEGLVKKARQNGDLSEAPRV